MAETSFPIEEQPLSSNQWSQVTQAFGQGIIAVDSEPYGVPREGINNANNTIRMGGRGSDGTGRSVVAGFYHRYDADFYLSIPPVATETTYYVGLVYDPLKHRDVNGPVSMSVTKSVPTGSGKVFLPCYEITRKPNQLLTDAVFIDVRAFVAPQITVNGKRALPPVTSVLLYTVATDWLTGNQYQMKRSGEWEPVGPPPAPQSYERALWQIGGWAVSGSFVVTPLTSGRKLVSMDLALQRTAETFTQGSSMIAHGTPIPTDLRSKTRGVIYVPCMIGVTAGLAGVNVTTGQLSARTVAGTQTISSGSLLTVQANWVAD